MEIFSRVLWALTGFFLAYLFHGIYVHDINLISVNGLAFGCTLVIALGVENEP